MLGTDVGWKDLVCRWRYNLSQMCLMVHKSGICAGQSSFSLQTQQNMFCLSVWTMGAVFSWFWARVLNSTGRNIKAKAYKVILENCASNFATQSFFMFHHENPTSMFHCLLESLSRKVKAVIKNKVNQLHTNDFGMWGSTSRCQYTEHCPYTIGRSVSMFICNNSNN